MCQRAEIILQMLYPAAQVLAGRSQKPAVLYYLPDCEVIGIEKDHIRVLACLQCAVIIKNAESFGRMGCRACDRCRKRYAHLKDGSAQAVHKI